MKYFIKTFGCQQNISDSERVSGFFEQRGHKKVKSAAAADLAIVNTCVVRQKAEDKFTGFIYNLSKIKKHNKNFKLIVTGCLSGTAFNDKTGKTLRLLKKRYPYVDSFLPVHKISNQSDIVRANLKHAFVPISNGCNNFCSYCIVPFARGREVSLSWQKIIKIVSDLSKKGYSAITLLGQNVNSYGNDLITNTSKYRLPSGKIIKPIFVNHLGKKRIPTLFPILLQEICKNKQIINIDFISANPWDFSDELIKVIKDNPKIDRIIHLPVQSGSDKILKLMNRWYSAKQYLDLVKKIRRQIPEIKFITDIIVGFPGETKKDFNDTLRLAKKVKFAKAFIASYSPRPGTLSMKKYKDVIPQGEKKRRFKVLDKAINHKKWERTPLWLRPAE